MKALFIEGIIGFLQFQKGHRFLAGKTTIHFMVADDMVFVARERVPYGKIGSKFWIRSCEIAHFKNEIGFFPDHAADESGDPVF